MTLQRLRGRARDDRGGIVVEFGLMFPIFALLISGIVAFGLAWNIRLTLTQAAREGVRVYALVPGGDWQAATLAAASDLGGVTLASSGDCDPASPGATPPMSWVSATREFTFEFAFIPVPVPPVTLQGRAVMRCGG